MQNRRLAAMSDMHLSLDHGDAGALYAVIDGKHRAGHRDQAVVRRDVQMP
jgi:hypothetical protein